MNYREVYSTGKGDLRSSEQPGKKKSTQLPSGIKNDGIVRIRKESKGRGGKTVTAIYGIPLQGIELKDFTKKIKQQCGAGGQVKDGIVFIQGDKTAKIGEILKEQGYVVKQAGA